MDPMGIIHASFFDKNPWYINNKQQKNNPAAAREITGHDRRWCPVPRHDDTKIHAVFEVQTYLEL